VGEFCVIEVGDFSVVITIYGFDSGDILDDPKVVESLRVYFGETT
jgi:hypothetical protein